MPFSHNNNPILWSLHFINRVVYLFVNLFSRAGLNSALRREIAELEREKTPCKVMSVGAGGHLGKLARTLRNGTVTEVDIDPTKNPDIVLDICDMSEIPDASYDVIFVLEVLEHVASPDRAVAEMHRVLRPGGRIMISVPFVFEIHEAPHDYFRYTRFGLAHLCQDFAEVQITQRNGYIFASVVPVMRLIMSRYWTDVLMAWVFCFLVALFWPVLWVLDRCIRSDALTTGYIVHARKHAQ